MKIIFLDIDGVMNSELLYRDRIFKEKLCGVYYLKWAYYKALRIIRGSKSYSLSSIITRPIPDFKHRLGVFKRDTDPRCWKLLANLVWDTKAFICVSSTWRRYFTIPEWNRVFAYMGLPSDCCVGITETRRTLRGEEIKEWMEGKDIENYVIFDDDSDMLPEQKDHLFLTDNYCGLTPSIVYRAKRLLNNEN